MAGFNSLTSPLTFANTQATWNSIAPTQPASSPTTAPAQKATPAVAPTQQATAPAQKAVVDPWAGTVWGSKANYDKAIGDYGAAKTNAYNSINDLVGDTGNKYKSGILDYVDTYKAGQTAINRAGVQNELAREEGRLGVLDMIGQGIRSGGVMLNNAGATNSSAAEQLGKAYSTLGRGELTKVGKQYELGRSNIANQQDDLNTQTGIFQRHLGENKVSAVNSIVQAATSQLAALNQAAQSASLPDRIAIETEKAKIHDQAMAELSRYDADLSSGIAGNKASTAEQNRASAQSLLHAGTAPENSFDYTSSIPSQFQGTGPFASSLPIFVGAPKKQDNK